MNCNHICHTRGLNPWVVQCPICCCDNPKYDSQAVSDIVMPEVPMQFEEAMSLLVRAKSMLRKEKQS